MDIKVNKNSSYTQPQSKKNYDTEIKSAIL